MTNVGVDVIGTLSPFQADQIAALRDEGMTGARIHCNNGKMSPDQRIGLVEACVDAGVETYFDVRGAKPDIVDIHYEDGDDLVRAERSVKIGEGDRMLFYDGILYPEEVERGSDAYFGLSFMPDQVVSNNSSRIAIDDGNILLELDPDSLRYHHNGSLAMFAATVELADNDHIYHEGVTSLDFPMHSGRDSLLTDYDLGVLRAFPVEMRSLISRIVFPFVETPEQVVDAVDTIRATGYRESSFALKIETLTGLENVRAIGEAALESIGRDTQIWVARGDLGLAVQLPGSPFIEGQTPQAALMDAVAKMYRELEEVPIAVIDATDVASSLKNHDDERRIAAAGLSSQEIKRLEIALKRGALGFMLAGEMHAGPEKKGQLGHYVVRAVANEIRGLMRSASVSSSVRARRDMLLAA